MTAQTFEVGPNVLAAIVLFIPVATLLVNWLISNRVAKVAAEVTAVHQDTVAVNTAVNHGEQGLPTLVQRVADQDQRGEVLGTDLADFREYTAAAFQAIAAHFSIDIPQQPAVVVPPVIQLPSNSQVIE